jgi:hypothetical protein
MDGCLLWQWLGKKAPALQKIEFLPKTSLSGSAPVAQTLAQPFPREADSAGKGSEMNGG